MGIEVRIEDNDGVCAPQVYSDTAGTRGENIYQNIGSMTIEFIHSFLSFRLFGISILT